MGKKAVEPITSTQNEEEEPLVSKVPHKTVI